MICITISAASFSSTTLSSVHTFKEELCKMQLTKGRYDAVCSAISAHSAVYALRGVMYNYIAYCGGIMQTYDHYHYSGLHTAAYLCSKSLTFMSAFWWRISCKSVDCKGDSLYASIRLDYRPTECFRTLVTNHRVLFFTSKK